MPILAGTLVILLLIASGVAALIRRRRAVEEPFYEEIVYNEPATSAVVKEPAELTTAYEEQPPIVAPPVSAFAWERQNSLPREEEVVEEERKPGESWVERAYRGPSPSNPSASLGARLKRAAFFDKRERDAASGLAAPLDPSAGLPGARSNEEERELA